MGITVSAVDAARLAGVSEKTVRAWIAAGKLKATKAQKSGAPASWLIDSDALAAVPGVTIDRERLAEIETREARTPGGILARLERLERENREFRRRIEALERGRGTASDPPDPPKMADSLSSAFSWQSDGLGPLDVSPISHTATRPPERHDGNTGDRYSLVFSQPSGPASFRTRADAARWLVRHGVNSEYTPKSWAGWHSVALEPDAVLRLARSLYDPSNHRINWRLRECDDPACICHEVLPHQGGQ